MKSKKGLGALVLDVLFPRRCLWCDAVVGFAPGCPCQQDVDALCLPAGPLVQSLPATQQHVGRAWAALHYQDNVRQALLRFKFQDQPQLADGLGQVLAQRFAADIAPGPAYHCLVPVPVSPRTMAQRGYNQSALLAKALATHTGLAVRPLLEKRRETLPQHKLERALRLANLQDAYATRGRVAGLRVLLIDDIYTTGSTLNECAKTLLAAGAAACDSLCVAAAQQPAARVATPPSASI